MAPSYSYHYDYPFVNELAVDRTFRHSPWISNPLLSALVFIAIGTFLVFYIQARSLTRKMRPTVAGVPTRLPATIVWGLFSLQHSQFSHVQAETVQLHGIEHICFGFNSSQFRSVLPNAALESIFRVPTQLFDTAAKIYQQDTASLIFPEVNELRRTSLQIGISNKEKSAWNPTRNEEFLQAVDLGDATEERTAVLSGQRFLNYQQFLRRSDASKRQQINSRIKLESTCTTVTEVEQMISCS